jgi:hypothetical protein
MRSESPANSRVQAPRGSIVTESVAERGDSLTVSYDSRPRRRHGSPASVSAGLIAAPEPLSIAVGTQPFVLRCPSRRLLFGCGLALSRPGSPPVAFASLQSFLAKWTVWAVACPVAAVVLTRFASFCSTVLYRSKRRWAAFASGMRGSNLSRSQYDHRTEMTCS